MAFFSKRGQQEGWRECLVPFLLPQRGTESALSTKKEIIASEEGVNSLEGKGNF